MSKYKELLERQKKTEQELAEVTKKLADKKDEPAKIAELQKTITENEELIKKAKAQIEGGTEEIKEITPEEHQANIDKIKEMLNEK